MHPDDRGTVHARTLVAEVERILTVRGDPELNVQVRDDKPAAGASWLAVGYTLE